MLHPGKLPAPLEDMDIAPQPRDPPAPELLLCLYCILQQ